MALWLSCAVRLLSGEHRCFVFFLGYVEDVCLVAPSDPPQKPLNCNPLLFPFIPELLTNLGIQFYFISTP